MFTFENNLGTVQDTKTHGHKNFLKEKINLPDTLKILTLTHESPRN